MTPSTDQHYSLDSEDESEAAQVVTKNSSFQNYPQDDSNRIEMSLRLIAFYKTSV